MKAHHELKGPKLEVKGKLELEFEVNANTTDLSILKKYTKRLPHPRLPHIIEVFSRLLMKNMVLSDGGKKQVFSLAIYSYMHVKDLGASCPPLKQKFP